ncbi:MAG: hypothetical protein IPL21_01345 [Saprospirales bacterium]|nr:hypothetical protein [Saprospirales bacterium]
MYYRFFTRNFSPLSVPNGTYSIVYVLNPLGVCPTFDTVKISIFELVGLEAGPDQTICKSTQPLKLTNDPRFREETGLD